MSSKPVGLIDEFLQGQERMETDAGQPIVETITTHRTYTTKNAPPSTGAELNCYYRKNIQFGKRFLYTRMHSSR